MPKLEATEILARYIYSRSQYRTQDYTVKHNLFMPPPDKRLSLFRILGMQETEIWQIGDSIRNKKCLGRADIEAGVIYEKELSIDPDDTPLHHACIIDWPEQESAILLKAAQLANSSRLRLRTVLA